MKKILIPDLKVIPWEFPATAGRPLIHYSDQVDATGWRQVTMVSTWTPAMHVHYAYAN